MVRFRLTELAADKAVKGRWDISLPEIAQATGVHRAMLSKMDNQPGSIISAEIKDKLCGLYSGQLGDLMACVVDAADLQ